MKAMAFLIESPWMALVAGAVFFLASLVARSRLLRFAATSWALYGIYEYGMKHRILCSGECNIRIDLILIFPFLLFASVLGILGFFLPERETAAGS